MGIKLIACCGLDCGKCEARKATLFDDDALRAKVAREWAEWNNAPEIKPEHINCMGCRTDGCKTYYCSDLCRIRKCTVSKGLATCGECSHFRSCDILGQVLKNSDEAFDNLVGLYR
ncbi:MAG: DUF3795 domain-containing protein [Muribaculaceae bacterium]